MTHASHRAFGIVLFHLAGISAFGATAANVPAETSPPPPPGSVLSLLSAPTREVPRKSLREMLGWVQSLWNDGTIHTAQQPLVVEIVTENLHKPWSVACLPGGAMLVTTLQKGELRKISADGVLEPRPIGGVPRVSTISKRGGLEDIALHPNFARNGQLYLTYTKPHPSDSKLVATALAGGRFDGENLRNARGEIGTDDIFVAKPYWDGQGGAAVRLAFHPDGSLFMSVGSPLSNEPAAQDLTHHQGKVLHFKDDGAPYSTPTAAPVSPTLPELFTFGHRHILGMYVDTQGRVWAAEHGPRGGDKFLILEKGQNYGWPEVSLGQRYFDERGQLGGPWQGSFERPGIAKAVAYATPSIAPMGLLVIAPDELPQFTGWRKHNADNIFVFTGSARTGSTDNTGDLVLLILNKETLGEVGRESLLQGLRQRIRGVWKDPSGNLIVITDEENGAVLRIRAAASPQS